MFQSHRTPFGMWSYEGQRLPVRDEEELHFCAVSAYALLNTKQANPIEFGRPFIDTVAMPSLLASSKAAERCVQVQHSIVTRANEKRMSRHWTMNSLSSRLRVKCVHNPLGFAHWIFTEQSVGRQEVASGGRVVEGCAKTETDWYFISMRISIRYRKNNIDSDGASFYYDQHPPVPVSASASASTPQSLPTLFLSVYLCPWMCGWARVNGLATDKRVAFHQDPIQIRRVLVLTIDCHFLFVIISDTPYLS